MRYSQARADERPSRLVQEMIVNDKVQIIAGGITPTALAYGQLVTQAKIATVVAGG